MSGGWRHEYSWSDSLHKPPSALSAPRHIERLMGWVEAQLYDIALFPKPTFDPKGAAYPPAFFSRVKEIFRRMLPVFAHYYYKHIDRLTSKNAEPLLK